MPPVGNGPCQHRPSPSVHRTAAGHAHFNRRRRQYSCPWTFPFTRLRRRMQRRHGPGGARRERLRGLACHFSATSGWTIRMSLMDGTWRLAIRRLIPRFDSAAPHPSSPPLHAPRVLIVQWRVPLMARCSGTSGHFFILLSLRRRDNFAHPRRTCPAIGLTIVDLYLWPTLAIRAYSRRQQLKKTSKHVVQESQDISSGSLMVVHRGFAGSGH